MDEEKEALLPKGKLKIVFREEQMLDRGEKTSRSKKIQKTQAQ